MPEERELGSFRESRLTGKHQPQECESGRTALWKFRFPQTQIVVGLPLPRLLGHMFQAVTGFHALSLKTTFTPYRQMALSGPR
jgi:hypothetical protein